MDDIRDRWQAGRRAMIAAIADLTTLALRAGVDEDAIHEIQGRFFDGNVESKTAFRAACLLAELRRPVTPPVGEESPGCPTSAT